MSEMFSQASGIGVAQGLAMALLVDGENIPQSLAGQITSKSLPFGRPIVQRVYGDVARLPNWESAAGFEMIHTGHAKNGADMRMCIDALDLAGRGGIGRVVLTSSDRDFTHLAQYLRAKGFEVIGMGEAKTHESLRRACSRFMELGAAAKPAPAPAVNGVTAPVAKGVAPPLVLDITQKQIAALITTEGKAGMKITALSVQMRNKHGFLIGQHDKKTWRGYLSAYPAIYDLDPKGPSACAHLK
jgi:uncharacterized LabA/DUF88 family protein